MDRALEAGACRGDISTLEIIGCGETRICAGAIDAFLLPLTAAEIEKVVFDIHHSSGQLIGGNDNLSDEASLSKMTFENQSTGEKSAPIRGFRTDVTHSRVVDGRDGFLHGAEQLEPPCPAAIPWVGNGRLAAAGGQCRPNQRLRP